jgi:uncharacterized protein YeaO (DUF488 family)
MGTVRRPPRGVPKARHAADNWYDVWLPTLAPSDDVRQEFMASQTAAAWRRFTRRYRAEMGRGDAQRVLAALAALSHDASFSVGCYCDDESRCHRSILRELLIEHGASVV